VQPLTVADRTETGPNRQPTLSKTKDWIRRRFDEENPKRRTPTHECVSERLIPYPYLVPSVQRADHEFVGWRSVHGVRRLTSNLGGVHGSSSRTPSALRAVVSVLAASYSTSRLSRWRAILT